MAANTKMVRIRIDARKIRLLERIATKHECTVSELYGTALDMWLECEFIPHFEHDLFVDEPEVTNYFKGHPSYNS